MSIRATGLSSHELRELFWREEGLTLDSNFDEDADEEYEDETCYFDLGDQEVNSE